MDPVGRVRRKAGDGLAAIPATETEWREAAAKYLPRGRLEDLCSKGRFSASTTPKEAFLSVRCIWPTLEVSDRALQYIVDTGSYFTEEHRADALNLIKRKLLGLDKLETLYEVICQSELPKTPRSWKYSMADELGPFFSLLALKVQLSDEAVQSTFPANYDGDDKPLTYAPKAAAKQWTLAERPHVPVPNPPLFRSAKRSRTNTVGLASQEPSSSKTSTPALDLSEDSIPPLTHTENLVVAFMTNFFGALASLVQPMSYRPVCMAHSDERTIYFGPITSDPQVANPAQFGARIDGSIFHSVNQGNKPRELVLFEAKRSFRKVGDVTVRVQQSMEHVAYIWDLHKNNKMRRADKYHTFMLAQDCLEFYISIGTYDNDYLGYIFGSGDELVNPSGDNVPVLKIQEFGPFEISQERNMKELVIIMLSLLIWQLGLMPKGADLIKEALSP